MYLGLTVLEERVHGFRSLHGAHVRFVLNVLIGKIYLLRNKSD